MDITDTTQTPAQPAPELIATAVPGQVMLSTNQTNPRPQPAPSTDPVPAADPVQKADEQQQKPAEGADEKDPAKKVADAAGLDYDAILDEFKKSGSVSDETQAQITEAVKKLGLPESVVKEYFDNLDAKTQLFMNEVYSVTGGEEGYEELVNWAREELPENERKVFSDLMETGDQKQALLAVKMLHGRFQQTAMTGGKRVKATSGSAPSGPLFRNMQELAAAQADPDYQSSVTKQEEVRQRLQRSVEAGVFKH